ncbi:MAG TPA: dTDP-4-dehydrorhamnose 3,5-epimerase family protein [Xanthobacteraceae bacterium]|nr:dTDP-4-dehydrorhamnose 3,5-epimerase family protein [Xanthobacteraceae bacterium]
MSADGELLLRNGRMPMTIAGVEVVPLRIIADERGAVMHMLRADAPHFTRFGEIYFSTVRCGAVKGWKRHRRMTLNLAVPVGRVRLVVFDDRDESPTRGKTLDLVLGPDDYQLVVVSPGLWTAFQGMAEGASLVANCASLPHDPAEAETRSLDDPPVNVSWEPA